MKLTPRAVQTQTGLT